MYHKNALLLRVSCPICPNQVDGDWGFRPSELEIWSVMEILEYEFAMILFMVGISACFECCLYWVMLKI